MCLRGRKAWKASPSATHAPGGRLEAHSLKTSFLLSKTQHIVCRKIRDSAKPREENNQTIRSTMAMAWGPARGFSRRQTTPLPSAVCRARREKAPVAMRCGPGGLRDPPFTRTTRALTPHQVRQPCWGLLPLPRKRAQWILTLKGGWSALQTLSQGKWRPQGP